jgi:hypothetical protein
MSSTRWQEYEYEAYTLFCSTGHYCQKDVIVQGARGSHQIDVLVDLNMTPEGHRWLVECKHRSRRIGKQEVLAFKTVIDDVGADHGYILSEQGFQKGAVTMARIFNISLVSLSQLREQFVREQLMPDYRQSKFFWATVKEEDDWGNMDSEAIVELKPRGALSVQDSIIEIHIVREGFLHQVIPKQSCGRWLTQEGTFRIGLPWEIPNLDLEAIPLDSGGHHLTGKTTDGMYVCGHYRVIFRTLTGPISVNAWVPTFK